MSYTWVCHTIVLKSANCSYRYFEKHTPVSYTHLDVYKRQLLGVPAKKSTSASSHFSYSTWLTAQDHPFPVQEDLIYRALH